MTSSSSKKQLTILILPLDTLGHIHASIGLAEPLKQRGHRIVFGIATGWRGKISPYGFEEILYGEDTKPAEMYVNFIKVCANELRKNSYGQLAIFENQVQRNLINSVKYNDPFFHDLIKEIKPDQRWAKYSTYSYSSTVLVILVLVLERLVLVSQG